MPAAARRALLPRLLRGALAALAAFLLLPAAPALAQELPVIHLVVQTTLTAPGGEGTDFSPVDTFTGIEGDTTADRFAMRYRLRSNIDTSITVNVHRDPDANAKKMAFSNKTNDGVNFGQLHPTTRMRTAIWVGTELQAGAGVQKPAANTTAQEDGVVTLSIHPPGTNPSYTLGTPWLTRVTILDDDTVMNVTPTSGLRVTEGGGFSFVLTPHPSPSLVERTVRVKLTATGDVSFFEDAFRDAVLLVGSSSATINVRTMHNPGAGQYGEIRAEVQSGAWKAGTVGVVTVLDSELEATISPPANGTVREGETATFTVSRNSPNPSALTVNVQLPDGSPDTVTIPANELSATLDVDTGSGDTMPGPDSTQTVSVTTGIGYSIGTPSSATVTVLDDDLTLTLSTSESSVTEADTVIFTVTANPAPTAERTVPVNVSVNKRFNLKLAGSADAYAQTLTTQVTLTASQTAAEFSVQIEDDTVNNGRGELQAQIQSGAWTVGAPSPLTLPVNNNDIPTFTITTSQTRIVGSELIKFTLHLTPPARSNLQVRLNTPFRGTHTRTYFANVSSRELSEFPVDYYDHVAKRDVVETITVLSNNGYEVGSASSISVEVLDDDTVMGISSEATSVVEGRAAAVFTVTPHPFPSLVTRTVEVDLTVTGNFELVGNARRQVVITEDDTSHATFSVEIAGDNIVDPQGELRAQVRGGVWKTADDSRSASVTILDNHPVVTVSPPAEPVLEGATAVFTLNLFPAPASTISVNVEHSGGGGSLPLEVGATTTQTFNVPTSNAAGTEDSMVTATVLTGTGYVVGAESTAIAQVLDDDAMMSITASQTSIAEGNSAEFTVTADPPPPSPRTVPVNVAVTGEFAIDGGVTSHMLELSADITTATFTVPIGNDEEAESSGSLTATLPSGPGYQLGAPSFTTIAILDEDTRFTVSASASQIPEGESVVFTVTPDPSPSLAARTVRVDLVATGNVAIDGPTFHEAVFGVDTSDVTFTVDTRDNSNVGADTGEIRAEIQSGAWKVGTPSPEAVTVLDNDAVMSVLASQTSIAEGDSVVFTVTANPAPLSPRTVPVNVAVTGEFEIEGGVPSHQFELSAATPTAMFMVTMLDDDEGELSGTLTATLASAPGYQLGTASAAVTLNSNDGNPDVNASNSVDANDALILYYAYSLRNDLGTGR